MKVKKENTVSCRVFCEDAGFDLTVPDLDNEILALLLETPEILETAHGPVRINEKQIQWIIQDATYKAFFEKIEKAVNVPLELLVKTYFVLVLYQDSTTTNYFANVTFLSKNYFMESFRNYNQQYLAPDSKALICPDIMFCTLAYAYMYTYQSHEISVPKNILPIILNIVGVSLEDMEKDFYPDLPYETDIVNPNKDIKKVNPVVRIFRKLFHR